MKIAIFGNTNRPAILSCLKIIFATLDKKDVSFLFETKLYAYIRANGLCPGNACVIENGDFYADLAL
ncbi:MAG: hypothetical protein LBS07_01185, partial [Prevotellaceae bacterium]|nr:hypothetical protein [Prevotellaceae bacterium]